MRCRALAVCILLVPGMLVRAEEPHLAQLNPPESADLLLPATELPATPPPTTFSTDATAATPNVDSPGSISFGDRSRTIVRPPTGERGLFLDSDIGLVIPNLRGSRVALPQYQPAAAWRVPTLNAADSNVWPGVRLAAGYRFDGGWGEIIIAARWASGSRDGWFANGDPRTDWFVRNQLPDTSGWDWFWQGLFGNDPTTDSDGSPRNPPLPNVARGSHDPLGVAHITTNVHTSEFDLAYGNGLYETQPAGLRFQAGARWRSASFEDINEGIGAKAREATAFDGFGPMASVYGELMVLGTGPFAEVSVGFFAKATGSLLFGRTQQIDEEVIMWPNPLSYRHVQTDHQQTVPVYGFSVGIVGRGRGVGPAFMVGYQFEEWKNVGRVGRSNFDLTMHGIFIRCTYNY